MAKMELDPIHQFEIVTFLPISLGGIDLSFTNASLFMVLIVACVFSFMFFSVSSKTLVPHRCHVVVEAVYSFLLNLVVGTLGEKGKRFLPFVMTIFLFVLLGNLFGMLPYGFTITSHLAVTASMALLVFLSVILLGFYTHGLSFLRIFVPSGLPWPLLILMIPIEIISFFARPVTLALRLCANMFAGHVLLKIIAGFAASTGVFGILPFFLLLPISALEYFVAFLQAYIFAILTCIYLNDTFSVAH